MSGQIPVGQVHHLRLTVTDVQRSREFYTSLLGFEVAVESPPPGDPAAAETFKVLFGGVVMARGNLILGLRPMAAAGDRFDPDRVGLDHLSFGVAGRDDEDDAQGRQGRRPQMRILGERPHLADALGAGDVSDSWAAEIAGWLRKLPEASQPPR